MKIHSVKQGSDEWHLLRAKHFTASEAPAMMGDSKYTSRTQLLHEKKTGERPPVSPAQQKIFAKGHATEESARPIVEALIDDELYPATGTSEEYEHLLASFDGITVMDDVIFEHKLYNETLAENVRNNTLELHYVWQLEQQLLVSGAERAIFVTSDGTENKMEHMWYVSVPERREALLAGWEQFAKDLAEYQPEAQQEVVVAESVEAFPVLTAQVEGSVVVSNIVDCLPKLREMAKAEMEKELETDLDFANKEARIKLIKKSREALKALTEKTFTNFTSLQEFKDAASEADQILQKLQSHSENLVKTEKESIKKKIIQGGLKAFAEHVEKIKNDLGGILIPRIEPGFAAAIKGKRNLQSMKDAVSDTLAAAKIEANKYQTVITANLDTLNAEAGDDYRFLFNDLQQIVTMESANFINLVKVRISEHKASEERKRKQAEDARKAQEQAATEKEELAPVVKHHVTPTAMSQAVQQGPATLENEIGRWASSNKVSFEAAAELIEILERHHINVQAA